MGMNLLRDIGMDEVEAVLAYLLEITWILNIAMISHILMNFVNAYV